MSRLWDTPEFWARSEADQALRDMPDVEPRASADSFERSAASHDGDPEMVSRIAADLRRRAAARIRFWPEEPPTESERSSGLPAPEGPTLDIAELIDDEIPW